MKFEINKKSLEEQLLIVSRAINNRTTLPVLSNVLIRVENGSLLLTTTNLEIAIETVVQITNTEDGQTTVPVKLFSSYISLLPEGNVKISLDDKETLHIKSDTSDTHIKCIPAIEFPIIPKNIEENTINLPIKGFHNSLMKTVFAAAIDERRPVLAGVYMKAQDRKLTFAASDSYRLAEKLFSITEDVNFEVITPTQTVIELVRIMSKTKEENILIKISKNQIIFEVGGIILTSRLIEGKYPDYTTIIPKETKTKVFIDDIPSFITTLKRVNLFAKEASTGVKFNITGEGVECVSDKSQTGTETSVFNCKVEGEGCEISFNAEYVIDAFENIGGDSVVLHVSNALSPGMLKTDKDKDYTHIVMPLKM